MSAVHKEQHNVFPQQDVIDFIALFKLLWSKKLIIIGSSIIVGIITALITLQIPNIYQSTTTLLPVSGEQNSLSQYAGIAAMAGVTLPGQSGGTDVEKIMALLNSRTLKERVIKDLKLTDILLEEPPTKVSPEYATLEIFAENYSASQDIKTSVITITYKDKDPQLSAIIVNYSAETLSKILEEKNLTISSKKLVFASNQLKLKEDHLHEVKNRLLEFQKRTQVLQPESQAQGVMELYTQLVQQKITLEVELETLKNSLSDSNPRVKSKQNQLEAITTQLKNISTINSSSSLNTTDVPENIAEYTEITTELELAQQMYIAMYSQWEQLKLKEQEDELYIEIIDFGVMPEEKIFPSRSLIVLGLVILNFCIWSIFLIFKYKPFK